jgi:hypothetical protein
MGIDYNKVGAPVGQTKILRAFFGVAAFEDYEVHQRNVEI